MLSKHVSTNVGRAQSDEGVARRLEKILPWCGHPTRAKRREGSAPSCPGKLIPRKNKEHLKEEEPFEEQPSSAAIVSSLYKSLQSSHPQQPQQPSLAATLGRHLQPLHVMTGIANSFKHPNRANYKQKINKVCP